MTKTSITHEDFLKLNGLLALAAEHNQQLQYINRAAGEITGEESAGYDYFGLTSDAVSESGSATDLCHRLGITVADEPGDA